MRRKRGRKPLPEALPRVEVIHEFPDNERICPHDGHSLTEIGAVTSEQLDKAHRGLALIRRLYRVE